MNLLQAFILGVIQGITEFLPVSSSTHLTFAKRMMGIEAADWFVYFELICHFGTIFALLTVFWKDVLHILKSLQQMALFTFALLPLIPAYFLFKPLRILWAEQAGFFLVATGIFMFLASSRRYVTVSATEGTESMIVSSPKWRDVLWIGMVQSLALLPGISRSGSTISMARMLGWKWTDAARFSFLLSIPTILGGSACESLHALRSISSIPWGLCGIGFMAALITGMGTVRLIFWLLNRGIFRPFAIYCIAIGLIAIIGLK